MFHVHLSNRLEALLDAFARTARAAADPLAPLTVVVPSAAMQRAATLHLADAWGVCTGVDFHYPAAWIWRQIARAVPGVGGGSPFDPDALVWRVDRAFADAAFVSRHPRLAAYLERADAGMRFRLAERTAALIEQYVTYRPDWLARWSAHAAAVDAPDDAWQAALWRRIADELDLHGEHPADALLRALAAGRDIGLPRAVHAIALPALPPLYAGVLQQLGRWTDIHVHALNPCREYWFDVVGAKQLARSRGQGLLFEQGNRLLAGWGRQTQAWLGPLLAADDDTVVDDTLYVPASAKTLLGALQNAILDLRELPPKALTLAPGDRSIELHVCHSPTRELEVLHDTLLAAFAADASLRPADIVVVTPALDAIAPLVDAVFGAVPAERRIPYAITGRADADANPHARLLLDVLAYARSRAGASGLLALLQQPAVMRRFGLDADALADIQAWMHAAGMRWGFDADHRDLLGVGADARHTLDDALQRLFLGYALPDAADAPFAGRVAAAGIAPSSAPSLGALWAVVETLRGLHADARAERSGADWCRRLEAVLDTVAAPAADDLDAWVALRRTLRTLAERSAHGAPRLPLAVIEAALQSLLAAPARGSVPSGAVTFASIAGLRGLPYRVVCAIGLDDGALPGPAPSTELDLMAAAPRAGDRRRRDDDRNAFLDLLLAARERLVLSHVGRSVRDNARLPPSVLAAELMDTIAAATVGSVAQRLVVEHPLQPFSLQTYAAADPRLRGHDAAVAAALRRAAASEAALDLAGALADDEDDAAGWDPRAPFFGAALAPSADVVRDLPLTRLVDFFRNPSRHILRQRLAIELPWHDEPLSDDEPFVADRLGADALAKRLLPHALAGADRDTLQALAGAGTEAPAGGIGRQQIDAEIALLQAHAARVRDATADAPLPPATLELTLDLSGVAWRLHDTTAVLRAAGIVRQGYWDTKPGDRIEAWLQHLLLCAAAPAGVAPLTRWLARDGGWHLEPVAPAAARERLEALVALHAAGLDRPLRFFPRSAWHYSRREKLDDAANAWTATLYRPYNESADRSHALVLRGAADVLDAEFEAAAMAVFGPLRAHLRDPRL